LLYPTLTRTAFKFFTCSREVLGDGVRFLEADFNIICWSPEHYAWAMTLGLFMLIGYAVGIPAFSMWLLKTKVVHASGNFAKKLAERSGGTVSPESEKRSKEEEDETFRMDKKNTDYGDVFSFMYMGFVPEFYYWEVIIMIRKFAIAFCAIILKPLGADIQAYGALIIVAFAMMFQIHLCPYEHSRMNFAELFGLFTLFITLYLGLVQSSPNLDTAAGNVDGTFHTALAALIVFFNVVFLLYIIWQLIRISSRFKKNITQYPRLQRALGFAPVAEVLPRSSMDGMKEVPPTSYPANRRMSAFPKDSELPPQYRSAMPGMEIFPAKE